MEAEAFFITARSGRHGQRFCLHHPAASGQPRALVLYVHPFAEELNKSRRMAALQAKALARDGCSVLQMDLAGCGDSAGDFGDASWQAWLDDVKLGCEWLRRRAEAPLWLWGLRAGCLVAAEAARTHDIACSCIFWQPVPSGRQALQQFLRLKVVGELLGNGGPSAAAALRGQLERGEAVEIAGYTLSPSLAQGLERATLRPPARPGRLEWIELSAREDPQPSAACTATLGEWETSGASTRAQVVRGPAFWQTTEIEEAPALLEATVAAIDETVPA